MLQQEQRFGSTDLDEGYCIFLVSLWGHLPRSLPMEEMGQNSQVNS
jgi:hypothetical protein